MEAFPLTPPAQLIKPGEEYLREQTVLNMLLIHLLVYQVVTDPPSGDLKKKNLQYLEVFLQGCSIWAHHISSGIVLASS